MPVVYSFELLQDYFAPFRKQKKKGRPNGQALDFLGAGARNRTEMGLRPGDFESPASTSFTTPARRRLLRGANPKVKKNVLTSREILC
jgi:hypothetical protein